MGTFVAMLAAFLVSVQGVGGGNTDTFDALKFKTAWVLLGELEVDKGTWRTQLHYKRGSGEGRYHSVIPVVGEQLTITQDLQLVILGYRKNGERDRLIFPNRRAITREDIAGTLLMGAHVTVAEIQDEPVVRGHKGVWARIVPSVKR